MPVRPEGGVEATCADEKRDFLHNRRHLRDFGGKLKIAGFILCGSALPEVFAAAAQRLGARVGAV